jgi:hypothetical protein
VSGLTNESESALPFDETFWNHIDHQKFSIGIPVSEDKVLNIIDVLRDIYKSIDSDPELAKEYLIMTAAILSATRTNTAELVWEEMAVRESMKELDSTLKEILNEKKE